jgi:hypothetical protein
MSILNGLRANVNSILGLRDSLGVQKGLVYLVTRTWSGDELGAGTETVVKTQMLPTPYIYVFTGDRKIPEGGVIKQGDIILRQISQQSYPTENLIDGSSTDPKVEKLYEVDGSLYRVIEVTKKHVTWKVILRRLSSQGA